MKLAGMDRRLSIIEEEIAPRRLRTLADFVLWRARESRGINEEVELDSDLKCSLEKFVAGC